MLIAMCLSVLQSLKGLQGHSASLLSAQCQHDNGLPRSREDIAITPMILACPKTVVVTADVLCIRNEWITLYERAKALVTARMLKEASKLEAACSLNRDPCMALHSPS